MGYEVDMGDDLTKESRMIGFHALDVIHSVMEKNRHKHAPMSWINNTVEEHQAAAFRHAVKGAKEPESDGENHLDHELTRVAMAIYVRDMVNGT